MELLNHDKPQTAKEAPSQTLLSEALQVGSNALHTAEHFVSEHKVASVVATVAAAGTLMALSKGREAGVAGEMVAEGVANVGKDAAVAAGKDGAGILAMDRGGILSHGLVRKGALPFVSLTALGLAGCDQEDKQVKAQVYKDADECSKDGVFTKSYCDVEYQKAKELHDQTVPKFTDKKECEDKTGLDCAVDTTQNQNQTPIPGHSSTFFYYRPYMYGFSVSPSSSGGDDSHKFVNRSAPLYRTSGGTSTDFVTSHGDEVSSKTGTVETSEHALSTASKSVSSTGEVTEHVSTTTTGSVTEGEGAFARSTSSTHVGGFSEGEAGGVHGSFGGEAGGHAGGFGGGE